MAVTVVSLLLYGAKYTNPSATLLPPSVLSRHTPSRPIARSALSYARPAPPVSRPSMTARKEEECGEQKKTVDKTAKQDTSCSFLPAVQY